MNNQATELLYKALAGLDAAVERSVKKPHGRVRPRPETSLRTREFLARFDEPIAASIAGVHPQTLARCGAGMSMLAGHLLAIEDVVHRDFEEFAALEKVLSQ